MIADLAQLEYTVNIRNWKICELTHILAPPTPPDMADRGRPRKNPDKLMKQFTHWLDPDDMVRVKGLLNGQTISEFVREAIAAEIKRRAKKPD